MRGARSEKKTEWPSRLVRISELMKDVLKPISASLYQERDIGTTRQTKQLMSGKVYLISTPTLKIIVHTLRKFINLNIVPNP